MNIKQIKALLEATFNVSLKKEKYPYPAIQTKQGILSVKQFFNEKRGFFFIAKMRDSAKKTNPLYLGVILSHNSSDLLMKIASKLVKGRESNRIMLFQTNNTKIPSGTKLIAIQSIETFEQQDILNAYEQMNVIFKDFQSLLNDIADSFLRR